MVITLSSEILVTRIACRSFRKSAASARSRSSAGVDTKTSAVGSVVKITMMRPVRLGDVQRADAVVKTAGQVLEKYKDYKAALADGFEIFMPNLPGYVVCLPHYFEKTGTQVATRDDDTKCFAAWMKTIANAIDYAEKHSNGRPILCQCVVHDDLDKWEDEGGIRVHTKPDVACFDG
jgi:hypothetical protein